MVALIYTTSLLATTGVKYPFNTKQDSAGCKKKGKQSSCVEEAFWALRRGKLGRQGRVEPTISHTPL